MNSEKNMIVATIVTSAIEVLLICYLCLLAKDSYDGLNIFLGIIAIINGFISAIFILCIVYMGFYICIDKCKDRIQANRRKKVIPQTQSAKVANIVCRPIVHL